MDTMGNFGEGMIVDVERFAAILACVAYKTRELRLEFNILILEKMEMPWVIGELLSNVLICPGITAR